MIWKQTNRFLSNDVPAISRRMGRTTLRWCARKGTEFSSRTVHLPPCTGQNERFPSALELRRLMVSITNFKCGTPQDRSDSTRSRKVSCLAPWKGTPVTPLFTIFAVFIRGTNVILFVYNPYVPSTFEAIPKWKLATDENICQKLVVSFATGTETGEPQVRQSSNSHSNII